MTIITGYHKASSKMLSDFITSSSTDFGVNLHRFLKVKLYIFVFSDCDYHQIQSARMMPCRVTSSDMDTMEKCRDMCNVDSCFGFRYNYDSLKCDLYSDQSCVLGKNLNYVIKKCHSKQGM